jgi:hypothetical protein
MGVFFLFESGLCVVKSKKIPRQDKEIVNVKLVLQELCMILLYNCVFYKVPNTPFYRHRIIMGG